MKHLSQSSSSLSEPQVANPFSSSTIRQSTPKPPQKNHSDHFVCSLQSLDLSTAVDHDLRSFVPTQVRVIGGGLERVERGRNEEKRFVRDLGKGLFEKL
ncbi:hypothetical protein V6N12_046267 [Hibiscus sabdariffa]|uniref:Uncharacterized protein n=1 Tax=Hibiscus sabdariffa TaxID=183260 RepID=A0ABR2AI17_9ROSI